ncbi:unnamed protein product, partial [Symbiodinium sp. CCMP2456]
DGDWLMPLHEMEVPSGMRLLLRGLTASFLMQWPKPEAGDEPAWKVPLVAENARELDIYNHSVQWTWADPGDPGNEWRPRDALANPEEEDDEMEEAAEEEGWEEEDPCVDDLVSEKALAILAEGKADSSKPVDGSAEVGQLSWNRMCNGNGEPIPRLGKCRSLHLMKA